MDCHNLCFIIGIRMGWPCGETMRQVANLFRYIGTAFSKFFLPGFQVCFCEFCKVIQVV